MIFKYATILALAIATGVNAEVLLSSGSFTVDRTPPEPPTLLAPDDNSSLTAAFLQLQVTAQDATSGIDDYQFEIETDASEWQNDGVHTLFSAPSQTYLWRSRARDRAGNVSEWSPLFSVNFTNDPDADLDSDGLADSWEAQYFGTLTFTDGSADSDGDGLTDAEEYGAGTHPYEFYIDLRHGWNLLSVPFAGTEESLAGLLTLEL